MAESRPIPGASFQEAFNKHHTLLKEHLEIWEAIRHANTTDSASHSVATKCCANTRRMLQDCANYDTITEQPNAGAVKSTLKRGSEELEDQPRIKKARKSQVNGIHTKHESTKSDFVPPTVDASGLFSIDVNPAPVSDLFDTYNQGANNLQRKAKQAESHVEGVQLDGNKSSDQRHAEPHEKRKRPEHEIPREPLKPHDVDDDDYQRTFERKVELRLKQKEEQRQRTANKKRKRESEVSAADAGQTAENEGPTSNNRTKNARKRRRHEEMLASAQGQSGESQRNDLNPPTPVSDERFVKATRKNLKRDATAAGLAFQEVVSHLDREQTRGQEMHDNKDDGRSDDDGDGRQKKARRRNRPAAKG